MNNDSPLIAFLEDKINQCSKKQVITFSKFLDMHQRSVAACVKLPQGVKRFFYGGFDDTERSIAVFLPGYIEVSDEADLAEYFKTVPEDCPVNVLEVRKDRFSPALTHRDYLGSLMALGIERDVTGDNLVNDGGCHIAVMKNIAGYIKENLGTAGRGTLEIEIFEPYEVESVRTESGTDESFTVSSPRLDSMVKNGFGVSREGAADAILHGLVFVNDIECLKPDKKINEGDKITLRHKGKIVISEFAGKSRKGKDIVKVKSFVKK